MLTVKNAHRQASLLTARIALARQKMTRRKGSLQTAFDGCYSQNHLTKNLRGIFIYEFEIKKTICKMELAG
jgi:hypothetical protein